MSCLATQRDKISFDQFSRNFKKIGVPRRCGIAESGPYIYIYTYKRVVCVCLSAFYRPYDICPLCGASSESERAGAVAGGPARAGKHALATARECMPYNFPTKKSYADAFQKHNRTRAHAVVTAEIFQKKGKRKPTCHFPSSVYSLPSLGVFTFRIVLNRILHKSSLLATMESRRTRRPTFTAEERLERRREQDRRRHSER